MPKRRIREWNSCRTDILTAEEKRLWGLLFVFRTWFAFAQEWQVEVDNVLFKVPDGFRSNGASVPFIVQFLIPAQRLLKAGLLHDWLYSSAKVSRKEADRVFLIACLEMSKAHWLRCYAAWLAVRLFAYFNYNHKAAK